MSWSSGKDSALALRIARAEQRVDVQGLLVTFNADADRVAMHAVRRSLVEAQADRLGLPLHAVEIPSRCPNDVYEERMTAAIAEARVAGIEQMVFGDLFLQDVREYRERNLAATGITPVFPLWGRPTELLARDMLAAGVRAVLTCVDPEVSRPNSAAAPSTSPCSPTCPNTSIPVASAVSSTRSCGMVPTSARRSTSSSAKPSSATASSPRRRCPGRMSTLSPFASQVVREEPTSDD